MKIILTMGEDDNRIDGEMGIEAIYDIKLNAFFLYLGKK